MIRNDMTEFLQLATLLVDPQDQNGLSVFSAQDHQGVISFHVKSSRKPA